MSTPPRPLHRRLPLPVTLEVNNLLALDSTPLKWARHEHTISLIQYIHLEIIVNQNQVVYDCRSALRTTRPCWKHLNEKISVHELSTEAYETMEARLSLDSKDSSSSTSSNRITLLQIPIHPSKLSRIRSSLPTDCALPLNAVIITFSDDSIRVSPSLYKLLVERQLVESENSERVNEFRRFRDDAFVALDQVPTPERRCIINQLQHCHVHETKDTFLASPLNHHHDDHDEDCNGDSISHDRQAMNGHRKLPPPPPPAMEDDPIIQNDGYHLLQEQQLLERLIEQESMAIEQDYLSIVTQRKVITCRQAIVDTREQTEQVLHDTTKLRLESQRTTYFLDVQRIRLFRELRIIYPITLLIASDQRYKIRDLEIPNDLHSASGGSFVSDEECFAALGYLCHLLIMMGKYLSVQYRYRMYYQASRSAIQNDWAKVFPLFMGRNIERDQFEQGVRLLSSNVDCLVKVRNIRVSPQLHILGKVKRVLEHVIDGY
jgi:hypothetical protein